MTKIIKHKKLGQVIFRAMTTVDVPAVYQVECLAYEFPWTENLLYDCVRVGYHCLVLEYQKKIIGYAIYRSAVGEAHLFNIAIDPQYQNMGLGRTFLSLILDDIRLSMAFKVMLEVRVSNFPARKLYKDFNFMETGIRKDYYPAKNNTREDGINLELLF